MAAFAARRSSGPVIRSISPSSRFNLYNYSYSMDRAGSTNRSISFASGSEKPPQKRTCMCSPTNHPGSFRCSLHKGGGNGGNRVSETASCGGARLNMMRRSAMKNSLVRSGTVEGGDWMKRALAALIRPSSHHQRRRGEFRPRPTRFSAMSKA